MMRAMAIERGAARSSPAPAPSTPQSTVPVAMTVSTGLMRVVLDATNPARLHWGIQLAGLTLDYLGWVHHWPIDATNLQTSTQHRNATPKPPEPMGATIRLRAPKPSPIRLGAHWINMQGAGQLNTPETANRQCKRSI